MKICFVGNFEPPNSTENDLLWTLRDMGHEVYPKQENRAPGSNIILTCRQCDAMLWVHTHGWETPGGSKAMLDGVKETGCPTASFHLDLYAGLPRSSMVESHPFFRTDYFFGVDGGSQEWYTNKGINHVYTHAGVVKRDCYLGQSDTKFCDVAFVGSGTYHESWPYRKKLLEWLAATYGKGFRHVGNPNPGLRGDDLNQFYAGCKVVVGDTLCPNFAHPEYWSDRPYEALGRGAFLIMPYVKGMEKDFTANEHLVFYEFNDWDGLRTKVDYYLTHDDDRELIRLMGHEHVRKNHTYHNRMETVVETLRTHALKATYV